MDHHFSCLDKRGVLTQHTRCAVLVRLEVEFLSLGTKVPFELMPTGAARLARQGRVRIPRGP
jgi:hypothetical protein